MLNVKWNEDERNQWLDNGLNCVSNEYRRKLYAIYEGDNTLTVAFCIFLKIL